MKKNIVLLISIGIILGLNRCNYDRPLKRELLKIWNEDQDIRNESAEAWKKTGGENPAYDSLNKIMHYLDSIHLVRVTKILDEKGWIGKDKIGRLANNTLFLVIQHSDLKTQQKYLPMMRNAVKEGKSEARWLALLEDRVALGEGKKQIYGSQIYWNKETNKSYVAPLEDPDNVDKRRLEMGLDPLGHYLKQSNLTWNVEEYKEQLPELEALSKVPIDYVANEKELAWLGNNCIQIKTVKAGNGFEDLQPLKKIIGNSRIVGLGEFSHGSSEVFQMKHRLVEFLVQEMGFNIFSIETNMPEASKLNDYVLHGEGNPKALLNGGDWIWNTQEILNMVEWMRKINSNGTEKIQYTGFDMQLLSGALENLEKFSNLHNNVLKSQIDSIKSAFSEVRLMGQQNPESIQDQAKRKRIYELASRINKSSQEIVSHFEKNKSSITLSIKESEYQWLKQNANIMVQSSLAGKKSRMIIRDSCMAENVTWLLNSRPDAKIILWAHNQHIGRNPGFLGDFLSKKYGNDYFNIGFMSNSGTAGASTPNGIESNVMEESKPGFFEYSFHKTKIPIFLFDFSQLNKNVPESEWLSKELNTRFIGSYIRKDSMIFSQNISNCYNSIIYIDSTHSSVRLSNY